MMKTNCTWQEVYAIYNTLLPYEKSYLGNHFIDSPYTVFRWIVKRNNENAGFIMLYDMKKSGSHKKELIVTVAIWEKYRGMGGLQELQDAAEKFVSSSSKYSKLIWLAKDANTKSIHCAEKLGYTKKFHELDHWVFDKTIESKELLDESNESFLSLNFYHASPSKYDKVIKPIAPNYGTKLYEPHWAVYMWKDKSLAYPYCLFTYIHKFMQKNFSKEERKDKLYECIKYGIYYMAKDVYEALKEHCVGKIAYIYTINVPLKDFIHIKLGHTNVFPEYSLDKEATIINREEIKITEKYFDKYVVVASVSNIKKLKKELAKEKEKNPTNILYNTKDDAYKVSYKFYIANAHCYLDTNKDLNEVLSNDELMIEAFNKELNTADYGIMINGKVYTGKNIDWRKYKTISPKDFKKYFAGTCWDYAEYEAKQFEEVFGFKHTLNDLKEKEYSMYYMQIEDNNMCPSHTWIVYKLNGKIYLFESSWMKYQGITEYNTEDEMVKDYIKKHRKESHDKDNPIIVTKYKPNEKFGLTPEEFMRRCIDQGKVIYSEIDSIPVQESKNMPMVLSEDDVYCNMSKFRNPCNIIFVCGTSGSGKSTLSKHLSNIHNATYVSLDHIMFWLNRKPRTDMDIRLFDPTLYEYYTENAIPFDELVKLCNSKDEKFFDYAKRRILDYIEWMSKQDEQFIVEGIQTSWVYDKDKFIVYPFVFKGTSMIKSWIRRAIREKDFFYKFDLKIALKWTSEWKRDVNRIRNAVMLKTTDIYTQKEVYINNGDR